jgi:hypothetical protein
MKNNKKTREQAFILEKLPEISKEMTCNLYAL